MKKRLTILTCLMLVCTFMFGQNQGPDWGEYYGKPYENGSSMTFTVSVAIDDEIQNHTDLEVAPYSDGKRYGNPVRLTQAPAFLGGKYIAQLIVNAPANSEIRFRMYDYRTNSMFEDYSQESFVFEAGIVGNAQTPQVINFYTPVTGDAEVNNVVYPTLAEAYAYAEVGSTITLLRDAQGAGIVIDRNVTIDFNGHAYTFSELGVGSGSLTSNGFQILKGNNVTLKNGTLNVAEAMKAEYYILVQNYANLNVENMNLDGTNLDKWSTVPTDLDSYVLSNNSGKVNIIKSTITANDEGAKAFAFDVCKKASYEAPIVTLDAKSTINGRVELSGGQFYPEQGVTVSLTKAIDPYDLENEIGWYTISAPFATNNINIEGEYTLFRYNEGDAMWENHKKHNFGIELGRGYLYANSEGNDLTLEGLANVDTYQTTLKYESVVDELKGNHLLGNPYTFDISGEHLVGDIANGFYQMAGDGAWVPNELTAEIAVGEGFLVQATNETAFAINKKPATKTRNADNGSLQINVANGVYSDVAYVSFNEGVGLNKISHQNANIPMVYVPVENSNYAIACLGEGVEEIPFSFEAKTMGTYTISVKAQNCEFSTMTLVDRLTGVETNLLFEDYSFIAKTSDGSDRFIIRLSNGTLDIDENFAYLNNNCLIINNASSNATLQIFDVMGRPVSSYNVSGNANISMESMANGVYVLRLIDENNVRVQKVVID